MLNRTRLAVLAFAGILVGTAPAQAAPPDFPLTNPLVAGQATAQVGLACTKCAAQVACAMVPLYQEVTAFIEMITPSPVGRYAAPVIAAAKAVGETMMEINYKKPEPNSDR